MTGITHMDELDTEKLEQFSLKVMTDIGNALMTLLSYIGDQTGVYRALCEGGRMGSNDLARAAGVDARYLREWLGAQAAAGYLNYHAEDDTFSLSPEQAVVLARDGHPACMQGYAQFAVSQFVTYEKALEVFRSGAGRPWGEHHSCCFCGTDRFFRSGYSMHLLENWLPALDGMVERLQRGARVADMGCGHGSSTVLMAEAFPASTFEGFDFHQPSVDAARQRAEQAGVAGNTTFEALTARQLPAKGYDLVCMFDALHDMGDPVGAARRIRKCLAPDGTFMVVEPLAGNSMAENMNLIGQLFYTGSTLVCTPAAKAQEVGLALGAQAGERRLTEVLREAGFTRVRRAAETVTNMVLEAKP